MGWAKKPPKQRGRFFATIKRILKRAWELPRLDPRTADEIIGYDEHGLPR